MRSVMLPICMDERLISLYGPSHPGSVLLPDGESGEAILAKAKITETERLECVRRGAEYAS